MLSLPLQSLVGNSHVRKVRRLAAAVCVGCLVLSGCSSGSAEAEGAEESVSGPPFAEPEDPTPKIPEYTVEEGLELSDDDKQLADEAVVFFTEYMAAANRAYKDGGVYWDKLIDMSSGPLREAQEESRREAEDDVVIAENDLKATQVYVGNVEGERGHVFVTACLHYDEWQLSDAQSESDAEQGERVVAGFDLFKKGDAWAADELSSVESKCE